MEVILNTEIEILGVTVNVFNQVFSLIATVLMIACYYVSRKNTCGCCLSLCSCA